MIGTSLTFAMFSLLGDANASLIRGTKPRTLQESCNSFSSESSCIDSTSCSWCEFKEGTFNPICLTKVQISSLPPGYYTCTSGRDPGTPQDDMPTVSPLPTISSSISSEKPSMIPSITPTVNPSIHPDSPPSCFDISEESLCVHQGCSWCEFGDSQIQPLCLERRFTTSPLNPEYNCRVENIPSSNPTSFFDLFDDALPSSIPSSKSSPISMYPTPSRAGVPPIDDSTCAVFDSERQCRAWSCKWCVSKDNVYSPTCLDETQLTSLPPGWFTCT